MPFGSFSIVIGDKPEKAKKPNRIREKRHPRVNPEKEYMPHKVREELPQMVNPEREYKPPVEEPFKFDEQNVNAYKIHILLVGRTQDQILDFLCSVEKNMTLALSEKGLSYYSRDNATVNDMIARKKKIEYFFETFSNEEWTFNTESEDKVYTYTVSPSGKQSKAIDMIFHCVTGSSGDARRAERFDAVWLLTDGMFVENSGADYYSEIIREYLSVIPNYEVEAKQKPVCLIMTQIERLARYENYAGRISYSKEKSNELLSLCKDYFEHCLNENASVAIFPAQVYGGMEYAESDTLNDIALRLSKSGFYQEYNPCACQLPCFYTLQAISALYNVSFFGNGPFDLSSNIRNYYMNVFGKADWQPMFIKGE